MVKIRLRRVGAKKQPSYRIVVTDSRAPRDGRFIETIGHYNPRTDPPTVVIKEDRALYWLSVGAQPSDAVARFFRKLDMDEKLKKVHGGAKIEDVAEEPAAAVAPAPEAVEAEAPAAEVAEEPEVVEAEEPAAEVAEEPEVVEAEEPVAEVVEEPEVVEAEEPVAEVVEEPEAEAPPEDATLSLEALGLTTRVANLLEADGIHDAGQLAQRLAEGDDALLAISGIGAKAVEEIREKLAEHGLSPDA